MVNCLDRTRHINPSGEILELADNSSNDLKSHGH